MQEKIESFLKEFKIVPDSVNSRSYVFDCPFCDGTKKLYVSKKDGITVCFKGKNEDCPKAGSKPYFAMARLAGITYSEAKRILASGGVKIYHDQIKVDLDSDPIPDRDPLPLADLPPDIIMLNNPEAIKAVEYLESRGADINQLIELQTMYSPGRRRVIFMVFNDGKLVGWQGRAIGKVDKALRMDNFPGAWKSRSLMFEQNIKNSDHVILTEGPFDALKFKNVGGYVATMGKSISSSQLDIILEHGIKNIYLALDRDAYDMINNIANYLNENSHNKLNIWRLDIPENREDFGDCTYEECELAFASPIKVDGQELLIFI